MKKGFTLIELLAVILILGIIALIAIPTVNKIIVEAKTNSFKSSNENIMKVMEEKCQISLMNNDNPIRSYIFKDSKLNYEIDIKGDTPNDGYVLLNNECEVIDYYLTNDSLVYTNDVDAREDYMLKAPTESKSIFNSLYPSYFSNIVTVYFVNHLNIPSEAIEIQDPSVSGNAKIKSWLVPNGENYDLYIGSEKTIYANYDSTRLFYSMSNLKNINTSNLNTSFVNNMSSLFHSSHNLEYVDVSNWDTSNVTTMTSLFNNCGKLNNLDVSRWNTSKVTNMVAVFSDLKSLTSIDIKNWNTSNVTNLRYLFDGIDMGMNLESIDMGNWNTSKVGDFAYLFSKAQKLKYININNWDLSKGTIFTEIFSNCDKLNTIQLSNVDSINKIIEYLPIKDSSNPGTIIVKGDKTGINETELNNKNWHIS